MATPSLYRRYRPRRFSELRGQDHVVRALRDAVRSGREGQAYLFSGPRGTGKTTSARILAKVLNCENPVAGEPCCECASCLAVEAGSSYDVHELDAASNNGVDAMRELIERASLGTPGRHKVYILDEVHMLSRAAEAALLKTLEEPPNHVVFVLATTDPQKVSDTIRSRTQHLRFRLLSADTLGQHVRWVATDAGLAVSDHAIDQAVTQGAGSARDALSALELIAAGGDDDDPATALLDEYVDALTAFDAGRALTAIARAVNLGDDARAVTDRLIRHLRDGFLSLMAPDLVQLPSERVDTVSAAAAQLGAPRLVRAIELLGEMLVEMRHVPEPRLLVEVATVRLCSPEAGTATEQLAERLARLERAVDALASTTEAGPTTPPPREASSGRAVIGGRARKASPPAAPTPAAPTPSPTTQSALAEAPEAGSTQPAPDEEVADDAVSRDEPHKPVPAEKPAETVEPSSASATSAPSAEVSPTALRSVWAHEVLAKLKPLPRALFTAGAVSDEVTAEGAIVFHVQHDRLVQRCDEHRANVEQLATTALGAPVTLAVRVAPAAPSGGASVSDHGGLPPDDAVDPDDLVDKPVAEHDPIERLTNAFPGSEVINERHGR